MENPESAPAEQSLLDTGGQEQAAVAQSSAGQPQEQKTAPGAFVNPDGTLADGWTSHLPDDAVPYKDTLSKYKTVPDMAKALANANHLIGRKLGVPTEKSSPEEVAAYRQALGIPEDIEQYDFTPEQAPEGFEWDKAAMRPFAEVASKHNVPPAAMKALAAKFAEYEGSRVNVIQGLFDKQRTEAIGALQKEYGGDFDKNISLAKQAAKVLGVNPTSYGFSDPEVVRGFVRMAQSMSEDKIGRGAGGGEMMNGKARAMDIMRNPENAWHKRYSEGDPEAVALVTGLLKQG